MYIPTLSKADALFVNKLYLWLISCRKTQSKIYESSFLKELVQYQDLYDEYVKFTNSLKSRHSIRHKIYLFTGNPIGYCLTCGKQTKWHRSNNQSIGWSYRQFCSGSCSQQSEQTRKKSMKTSYRKYGVSHHTKADEVKEKYRQTCIERYGMTHSRTTEVLEKTKQTCIDRYGADNPSRVAEFKEKRKDTHLKRFGVVNAFQSETVKRKMRKTCRQKYGVSNPMQNADVQRKALESSFHHKMYRLGNKTILVRGFEPQALNKLVNEEGFDPRHIITDDSKRMVRIKYKAPISGRIRSYTPDIYVETTNTIIEVKSTRTMFRDITCYKFVAAKARAVVAKGYNYRMMLMSPKGKEIPLPNEWYKMGPRQIRSRMKDYCAVL